MTRKGMLVFYLVMFVSLGSAQQTISRIDRERTEVMLRVIGEDVRKHYYDPAFHGVNWDGKLEEARQKIGKAPSTSAALSEIAAALDSLNDSHTFFVPPQHVSRVRLRISLSTSGRSMFGNSSPPKE